MTQPTRHGRIAALVFVLLGIPASTRAAEGDLLGLLPFSTTAPHGFDFDEQEQAFWVAAFLDGTIHKYSADLKEELDVFRPSGLAGNFFTGLAFNSHAGTLFVVESLTGTVHEFDRQGLATGRFFGPTFPDQTPGRPFLRGLSFDPGGDNGNGSLYAVESTGTLVLEFDLNGAVLRSFVHPNDPDGFPGEGRSTPASGIDCIHENGNLVGFYLTGGTGRIESILRLNRAGAYVGRKISLQAAGGNVFGILRQQIAHPVTGIPVDAFVCSVDSNARFALLRGGEPSLHELVGLACTAKDREITLTWNTFQDYDRVVIENGCETLATLPGTAKAWIHTFLNDGVYEVMISGYQGTLSTTASCTAVVGGGAVLRTGSAKSVRAIDLAHDGGSMLYTTNGRDQLLRVFDINSADPFSESTTIPIQDEFHDGSDLITGIAYKRRSPQRIFLFNNSRFTVGVLDEVGALLRIFDARLPGLDNEVGAECDESGPCRGFVEALTFDESGQGGAGSLWLVETDRDRIYEIDLNGNVLHDFVHPYRALDSAPANIPFGIHSGGIAIIDSRPGELLLGGGTLRDGRERHILRVDKRTGRPLPGSAIPTDGLKRVSTNLSFTLESLPGDPFRVVALTHNGGRSKLVELRYREPDPPAPTFLDAQQPSLLDEVELEFVNNGPYDRMEIIRDCEVIAEVSGDAECFLDEAPPPGQRHYGVRAQRGGAWSQVAEVSVQVGPGALLERAFLWPAQDPHQLTQDPVDGSLLVAVLAPRRERTIYRFDRHFVFQESREIAVENTWQIDALAVRAPLGKPREVALIVSERPVRVGNVAAQAFDLVTESIDGEPLSRTRIFPPRPTNGLVTFPTGLSWNAQSDTFYFLGRNTQTILEMAPGGEIIRQFPHPAPPFQNDVMNFGLSLSPTGTLLYAAAAPTDLHVTAIGEMSLAGVSTGRHIPLGALEANIGGFVSHGDELIAVGTSQPFSELLRLKARDPSRFFLRGDSDGNGKLGLTDAVVTLNVLFLGGGRPACEDAFDTDDSAHIELNDAVVVLNYLFLGGTPPAAPFPAPGVDPTADGLDCF